MTHIFWDFNGTILDDARLCHDILVDMLAEEGQPTVSYDEYLMIFDFPVEAYYAKVYDFSKTNFDVLAQRFIERYQPQSLHLKLHDHVLPVIDHFARQGIQNVLLSASEQNNLLEQLEHYGIGHHFAHVLGTSNVHAVSKIDVARQFINDQKIDPSAIILVGDTLHDAEVAEALGCPVILYTKGHQHPDRLTAYDNIDDFRQLIDIMK